MGSSTILTDTALIAWVMPVYNGERYVKQAIESILNQPCKSCEIWVVDDGSTDSTAEIVRQIADDRIHYLYQENAGCSAARNLGVKHAEAKYIAFLDADDVLCKNAYDEEVYGLLESECYDIISFSYLLADQDLKKGTLVKAENKQCVCNTQVVDCYKSFCLLVYSKTIFEGNGAASFYDEVRYSEDVVFLFGALQKGNMFISTDHNWFVYRNNISSAVHTSSVYEKCLSSIPGWYRCREKCIEKSDRDLCDACLFSNLIEYIRASCRSGVPLETMQAALKNLPIQETIDNYDALWESRKKIYEQYLENPKGFWEKERRIGRLEYFFKKLACIPIIRRFYFQIKYKVDIREFI